MILLEFPPIPDDPVEAFVPYIVGMQQYFDLNAWTAGTALAVKIDILYYKKELPADDLAHGVYGLYPGGQLADTTFDVTSAFADLANLTAQWGVVLDVQETPDGSLWAMYRTFNSSNNRPKLYAVLFDPATQIRSIAYPVVEYNADGTFDYSNGLLGMIPGGDIPAAVDPDGHLWILTYVGAQRINAATGIIDRTVPLPSSPKVWGNQTGPQPPGDAAFLGMSAGKDGLLFVARHYTPAPIAANTVQTWRWWFLPWNLSGWILVLEQSRTVWTGGLDEAGNPIFNDGDATTPTTIGNLDVSDRIEWSASDVWAFVNARRIAGAETSTSADDVYSHNIVLLSLSRDTFGAYTLLWSATAPGEHSEFLFQVKDDIWALDMLANPKVYRRYSKSLGQYTGQTIVQAFQAGTVVLFSGRPMHQKRARARLSHPR